MFMILRNIFGEKFFFKIWTARTILRRWLGLCYNKTWFRTFFFLLSDGADNYLDRRTNSRYFVYFLSKLMSKVNTKVNDAGTTIQKKHEIYIIITNSWFSQCNAWFCCQSPDSMLFDGQLYKLISVDLSF